jgi:hypothetical protein
MLEPELDPDWPMLELDPDWPELELPELLPDCATMVTANSSATANTNSEYFRIFGSPFCGEKWERLVGCRHPIGVCLLCRRSAVTQSRVSPRFVLIFKAASP